MHVHRREHQLVHVPFPNVCHDSFRCRSHRIRLIGICAMTHESAQAGAPARPCSVHKCVQQETLFVHFGTWMMQVPVLQRVAVRYSVL